MEITRTWLAGGGAAVAAAAALIAPFGPSMSQLGHTLTDFTLTAATADTPAVDPATGYPTPTPPGPFPDTHGGVDPNSSLDTLFTDFKTADLNFNSEVQTALNGNLPTDSLPPIEPQDALIYDIEAPGNLVRGDLEAFLYAGEYIGQGEYGQAAALLAPIPVDSIQGLFTIVDTNLTGLAEAIGIPQADIDDFNNAVYLPALSTLSGWETDLANGATQALSSLDPSDSAAALDPSDLGNVLDFSDLSSLF